MADGCHEIPATGGRHHFFPGHHLGLQERWLVEQVIAVRIVARDFDDDLVAAGFDQWRNVPFIHPVKTVARPRRTMAGKLAVDIGAVKGRPRHAQCHCGGRRLVKGRAEFHEQIALRFPPCRPDWFGGQKRSGWLVRARPDDGGNQSQEENAEANERHGTSISTRCNERKSSRFSSRFSC